MLVAAICILLVFFLLVSSELLWRQGMLRGEWLRKFAHASIAGFVAFWPWLISWQAIRLIGLAFLAVVLINRRFNFFNMMAGLRKSSWGDINFALAVIACALLTDVKIFFSLAILHMALADSIAALAGQRWGQSWRYQIFGQLKTVVGTMAFWVMSLLIIGIGGLFAHSELSYNSYLTLLILLPPTAAALENFSYFGLDNLTVPVAVVLALKLVS